MRGCTGCSTEVTKTARGEGTPVLRVLAVFWGLESLSMAAPLAAALVLGETGMVRAFCLSMAPPILTALAVFVFSGKGLPRFAQFGASEGIRFVFFAWALSCLTGALPYWFSGCIPSFSGAVFESVSGFTTTGTSVIPDLEALPYSLHLWRGLTHWLGGIGIIVFTVALVPLFDTGAFRLVKAETTGPEKDRLTPRIAETAKILILIYVSLTALQALLFLAGGMNWFDAVFHSFSTVATGGFSTHNDSIAHFNSPYVEWVTLIFMVISGLNFSLVYRLLRGRVREAAANSEARAYFLVIAVSVLLVAVSILSSSASPGAAVRHAFFMSASVLTTTGFIPTGDYTLWPPLAEAVLFLLMFSGACSGSTSGGVKVIRYVILGKQMKNEMKKLLFPRGVFAIRIDQKAGRKDAVYGVAGFIFLYFAFVLAGALLVCSSGTPLFDSLNTSLSMAGNIGAGLGKSNVVLYTAPGYVRWGLSFLMLAGRLELMTVLVLFIPGGWRGARLY
jgi:trk system potassium uptake protein TrkH